MNRFVEHFHREWCKPLLEVQINQYAEENNLTIINIAPCYGDGIYVLFERRGAE